MQKSLHPFLLYSLLLCTGIARAQTLPDPEPERVREAQRIEALRQNLEATPSVRLQTAPDTASPRLPIDESPCFTIRHIDIEGALPAFGDIDTALEGADRQDPPQGRCLGTQGIRLLLARLQNHLIAQGFVTTRVEAPRQDLTRGVLSLVILPGRIHQIRRVDAHGAPLGPMSALPARGGDLLNLRDIEQALENLTRVPSADADIQIAPAELPGYSDLLIQTPRTRPLRGALAVDDAGSKTTGKYQATATVFYDNPLQLNDQLYLSLQRDLGGKAPGERGNAGQVLHYSLPRGYWLLGLTDTRSHYHQAVAGAVQTYLYRGESSS